MAGSKESIRFLGADCDRQKLKKLGIWLTIIGMASFVTPLAIPVLAFGLGTLWFEKTAGKKK